jgi:hypothetical protein
MSLLRRLMFVLVGVVLFGFLAGVAVALPEGRVYEMVSPPYKGGYGVGQVNAVAPDGERLVFGTLGAFAGPLYENGNTNDYVARRGSSGWTTTSLTAPPIGSTEDFSGNLEYALANVLLAPKVDVSGSQEFMLHRTDAPDTLASWAPAGPIVNAFNEQAGGAPMGASRDLCHLVLQVAGSVALLPEAINTQFPLYDFATGCDGESSLRLVGVNNQGGVINPKCEQTLGITEPYVGGGGSLQLQQQSTLNSLSADGKEIFFTTDVGKGSNCEGEAHQLFVRLGGSRTLEVSGPMAGPGSEPCSEVPCPGAAERASAYFKGASEDGSRVFFTTTAPVARGDKDTQNDLYMASVGCPEGKPGCVVAERQVISLVRVSRGLPGEPADVQGVVRIAPDGAHVYFVAHGVLSVGASREGFVPVRGAENLYAYDTETGALAFVADLCSGSALSGEVEDSRCPRSLIPGQGQGNDGGLWGSGVSEAQSTVDGGFLVFSSFGQLAKGDTDTARDVYRYDAVSGVLERVSLGEAGYDANGNDNAFDAEIHADGINPGAFAAHELMGRAISEDGSRVVFETSGPLSPDAINALNNVYEWHEEEGLSEGVVSLISSGSSLTSDSEASISPSGRDISFLTSQGLVSQDTDGVADVYDARLGGGFSVVSAPRQPCSGDACQGPLTNPAPLLVAGSVSQAPGENVSLPAKASRVKKHKAPAKKKKKASRGRARRAVLARGNGVIVRGRR